MEKEKVITGQSFRKTLKKVHRQFKNSHVYIELSLQEFELLKEVFSKACLNESLGKATEYSTLLGKMIIQQIELERKSN